MCTAGMVAGGSSTLSPNNNTDRQQASERLLR